MWFGVFFIEKIMANYTKLTEEELGKEISDQFLLAKRYLDPIHERMNLQEELYRTFIDKNSYPHNARVFDPRVFRVIETITPRMVANEPTGSFYPSHDGSVETSQIFNTLIKYDWNKADMFPKQVNFVKSMLIFGTAFGRTFWDFRERERHQMVATKLDGRNVWTSKNTEKVKYTEFDSPNFEVLNIYDCFPDPNCTNVHNMRWFIYRSFKTLAELKSENDARGLEYWKNLDKLEEMVNAKNKERGTTGMPTDIQYREHRRVMLSTQELLGQDESNPDITVLIRYTREGWCFVCPEYGNLIIREVVNPYFHGDLPIVYGVDYPYPGELYGMGEIEPIDRIQRAINAVLNQRLDNVQLTLRTMWKVKKNAGVDMHTLVSAPGNIITTNDMSAIEPLQTPDVTGATFVQTMNYLTSSLQNGSGITDYTIGLNTGQNTANETATGTRLIQQEANAQFKLKIQLYNHMVVERIANQWKDLRIQFTTEEQKLRIIGKNNIDELKNSTDFATTDVEGNPIIPGDYETKGRMEISQNEQFAFLRIFPDDIQPSIVGDYDFVASVAYDQVSDPVSMQEGFFTALEKISSQPWTQGLAMQGKMPNFEMLTEQIFEKLHIGVEGKDAITDIPQQPQIDPATGQPMPMEGMPLGQEDIQNALGQELQNAELINQQIGGVQDGSTGIV